MKLAQQVGRMFSAMVGLYLGIPTALGQNIVINEFMARNTCTITNVAHQQASDWIELYNTTAGDIDLEGWHLTDNIGSPQQWTFPATNIGAYDYLLVFTDNDYTNSVIGSELFANFGLSGGGEEIGLYDWDEELIDSVVFGSQETDWSYGRYPDGSNDWTLMSLPTPGETNNAGMAETVVFSVLGGVFTNEITVELFATNSPTSDIYYTVDGSVPATTSLLYSTAITTNTTVQIRARTFDPGLSPGPVVSHSYIKLAADVVDFTSDLPIVIVDNYGQGEMPAPDAQTWQAGCLAIYDRNTNGRSALTKAPDLQTRAGYHRRGESTLRPTSTKPNLAVNAWEDGGDDRKNISPLGMPAESDWILLAPYSVDRTLIHNAFIYTLANQADFYSPRTRFVEVFLNAFNNELSYSNDYAGVYVLMEEIKRDRNRVNIDKLDPGDNAEPEITGGYMLKSDKHDPGLVGFQTSRGTPKIIYGPPDAPLFWFTNPNGTDITAAQQSYITNYYEQFEEQLWAGNYDPVTGYPKYIDVDSFVNFWLFGLLAKNSECAFNSQFMYKPRGGKLTMGPLWDFNASMESTWPRDDDPTHWDCPDAWAQWNGLMTGQWGYQLFKDPDYWQKWIDRWAVLRKSTTSLTNIYALIDSMTNELNEAQVRNFTKWTGAPPRTSWEWEINNMKSWLSNRVDWIDGELLDSPVLSDDGGQITNGFQLTITAPVGATNCYTLDGTDPRAFGGSNAATAYEYTGPITLTNNVIVRVRAYDSSWESVYSEASSGTPITSSIPWSAVEEAVFVVTTPTVSVSEVMYDPRAPDAAEAAMGYSASDFEYVEVKNSGEETAYLAGIRFTDGIDYDFSYGAVLALNTGDHVIVVNNLSAFTNRYKNWASMNIAGEYEGSLDNGGERIVLEGPLVGQTNAVFRYNDSRGWPVAADGAGHSLVPLVTTFQTNGILDYCGNWRASTYMDGSPGEADPDPLITVVLNELGAHTDTALPPPDDSDDSIELYNCEVGDRSLADWYLSDDPSDLTKWQIPMTRVITGRTWMTFTENTGFHTNRLDGSGFGLNKDGEQVYLSYLPGTAEDRVAACVRFKGQENGVSLGRYVDGSGYWYDGLTVTTNAANAAPSNHVVISEIMYDPASTSEPNDTVEEFIELHNRTVQQVDLWNGAGTWRLDGLGYTFPTNTSIPAGGYLVVVPFDPETNAAALSLWLSAYGLIEGEVRILGPYSGKLSNRGERMALERPQEPDWPATDISWVIVDEVIYFNQSPWPTEPNGTGKSLQRIPGSGHGCDPNSWRGTIDPTPGTVGGTKVVLSSPFSGSEFLLPFSAEVKAEIDPFQTSGSVQWVQFYLDTSCIYTDTVPPYEFTLSTITTAGIYALTAQVKDSAPGVSTSQPSVITVYGPLSVNNDIGATDVTEFTAQLHGSFSGTATADCYFYWGGTDGGSNSGAWANEVRVGIMPSGAFPADIGISGLDPGDDCYYRACVKKAGGAKWADSSVSFQVVQLSEWPRKAKITFVAYDRPETLYDFPALVIFGTNITGFAWDELGSEDGYDLRFTDETGENRLRYEVEKWDTNVVSLIWVNVPALTSGGHIWAYWGKSVSVPPPYSTNGATWQGDYSAVWHFRDVSVEDSTDSGSDGVSYNVTATAGKVGNGLLFNGTDSGVVVPMYQKDTARLTASAWVWDAGSPKGASIMGNEGSSILGQFKLGLKTFRYGVIGTLTGQDDVQVSAVEIRGSNPQGSWEYVAMVADGSMVQVYRNGLQTGTIEPYVPPLKTSFGPLGIGVQTGNGGVPETNRWNGIIDEVRVSTTGRSSNWIWACWLNQSAGAGFCDYGSAEDNEGLVDLDGDDMADEWEVFYFGSTNAVSGGPYEDKDGDGQVNLHEYIAGTVPTNAESCLAVELIFGGGEPVVRYYAIQATGTAYTGQSRWYDLEDTTNLPSGGWLGILGQTNIEAVSSQFRQYTNAIPANKRFFRLKARLK